MKCILLIIQILFICSSSVADELIISVEPELAVTISIFDPPDDVSIYLEPTGKVTILTFEPAAPLSSNGGKVPLTKIYSSVSKSEYIKVLQQCKTIIKNQKISGNDRFGDKRGSARDVSIQLGQRPILLLSYGLHSANEEFPSDIKQLFVLLSQLGVFNKALKAQPSAAGTPQSGAP